MREVRLVERLAGEGKAGERVLRPWPTGGDRIVRKCSDSGGSPGGK